jgi:hypothetical protein
MKNPKLHKPKQNYYPSIEISLYPAKPFQSHPYNYKHLLLKPKAERLLDLCLLLLYIVLTTQKNSLTIKTFERLSLFGLVPSFS